MHPIASLRRWMAPAPDSAVADALRSGKSPWSEGVHLLWTVWVFLTPMFGGGFTARWAVLTGLSYPLFLWLYAMVLLAPAHAAKRYALGMVRLAPAAIGYLFHRNRGRIKAAASREFLSGATRAELEAQAKTFAEELAPTLLRGDALQAWKRWRTRRAKLVIVTASPDVVVAPFARGLGADVLIATELAFDLNDRATGGFATPNCRGPEKVRRLKAMFGDDLILKAAYGDTSGDREMLRIADHRGYRVFKSRP